MSSLIKCFRISVALAGALASTHATAQDTIRIGAPLELSGRFVAYGAQGKRGVEMAVDVYGGKIGNRKIEVLFRDVQSNNQAAVTAFTELTQQEKVDFVIGPIASGIVAASVPAWRQSKPLWIVGGSSSTQLEDAMKGEQLFFHTYPWAYQYHESTAKMLSEAMGKSKKVAIIYSDGAYGREQLPWAKEFYTKNGFSIVATELVREGAADLNPVLQKIRLTRPDVLVGIVQTTDGIQLAKQVHVAKLNIPVLVGTAYPQLQEWSQATGEAADGWIGATTYLPGMKRAGDPKLSKLFPSLTDWEADFKKRYNREPEFLDVTNYTSMMLLLVAIERAGSTDKEKVAKQLTTLNIQTMLGTSNFVSTPGGALHQAFNDMVVFQRVGDKFVVLYPADAADGKLKLKQ
ncbi:ABC transporter substrate-binding protein [Microbacteriaceae bacterium K1510]|nr:ABC transporter substrate-binding protein [Microbacteriaceae bacterium K1510]